MVRGSQQDTRAKYDNFVVSSHRTKFIATYKCLQPCFPNSETSEAHVTEAGLCGVCD